MFGWLRVYYSLWSSLSPSLDQYPCRSGHFCIFASKGAKMLRRISRSILFFPLFALWLPSLTLTWNYMVPQWAAGEGGMIYSERRCQKSGILPKEHFGPAHTKYRLEKLSRV
jgi:hypothetical protein